MPQEIVSDNMERFKDYYCKMDYMERFKEKYCEMLNLGEAYKRD
jgi:hypothetical protein